MAPVSHLNSVPCVLTVCANYLHALHGLNGSGLRTYATPINRRARRVEEELRVLEQSMKSLSCSVTQVLQTKTNTHLYLLMSGSVHFQSCCSMKPLLFLLCLLLFTFGALVFRVLHSFMPLTQQRLCKNNLHMFNPKSIYEFY